jgi:hypothetical protein
MATLASILADLFGLCGLSPSQYDVSAGTDTVDGFRVMSQSQARDSIDGLLRVYSAFLIEVDGKLILVKRGGGVTLTVAEGDLAARIYQGGESDPPPKVEVKRVQELELPFRVDLSYLSKFRDYEQATQGAVRYTKLHLREALTLGADLALTEATARLIAERILYDQWTAREQFTFSLPPRYLALVPGDVLTLPMGANSFRVRVVQVDVALPGPISVTAVLDDAAVLTQEAPGGAVTAPGEEDSTVQETTLTAWSGNALTNDQANSVGLYLAANGATTGFWPGTVVYWSRDSGASFQELQTLTDPATVGTTSSVLAAGTSTGVWDDTNTVDVLVSAGSAPASTSDAAVLEGDNVFLVGDEVLQAGTITSLGGGSYRLAHLIRGARGTDAHWGEHRTGERFAILEGGQIARVELGEDLRGKAVLLKAVGQGQAVADVTGAAVFVSGDEYRCYSPWDPEGLRDGGNNLTITWLRRTRVAEGLQDSVDEPLGETTESYTVAVRSGTPQTITAVSNATSAVVSSASHGFAAADVVILAGIKGMPALEGVLATITATTTNTFTVSSDTSGMPAYVSGGTAEKVLRQITSSTETASYSAADQTVDFGSPQPSISLAIYQSGRWGEGFPLLVTL